MRLSRLLFWIVLAGWIGRLAADPALAADAVFKTPEAAVSAYIDGVARQDFNAILATTAAGKMSGKFDFVGYVDRLNALIPSAPAPATAPLFVAINRADFEAQIGRQVLLLDYGLMTSSKVLEGSVVTMDASGAAEFQSAVRADQLAGLTLVKIGIPRPALLASLANMKTAGRIAKVYGAAALTERVALLSFKGANYLVGFRLLQYGDAWTVMSQWSPLAGTDAVGTPKRVTPEEFQKLLD